MSNILRVTATVASLLAFSGAAFACPNGYKRVVIQGNSICQLDASASTKLKANTGPTLNTGGAAQVKSR